MVPCEGNIGLKYIWWTCNWGYKLNGAGLRAFMFLGLEFRTLDARTTCFKL